MPRAILDENQLHPAIRQQVAEHHCGIVREVQAALKNHRIVVVGMATNPMCTKARKVLDAAHLPHHYLQYGGYLSKWRERNALKMWTGWPTFPLVFVEGVLVGGYTDLRQLLASGALQAA